MIIPSDDPTSELPNSPLSDGPYPSGQATGVSNTLWRPSRQYEEQNGLTHTKAATDYGYYEQQRIERR